MKKKTPRETTKLIKTVAKGGLIVFFGALIGKIFRFIFNIILARILGVASYGLYSLGLGIFDVLANIGSIGSGAGMIRYGSEYLHKKDIPRLKGTILSFIFLSFFVSIIIAVLIFSFAEVISMQVFKNYAFIKVLKIFAFGFPFYILSHVSAPIGFVFHKFQYKVIVQEIFQPIVNIIVVIIIFLIGFRLYGAVSGFVASSVLSAFLSICLIKKLFPEIFSNSKAIFDVGRFLRFSYPIIFILFSYFLIFRFDRIVLGIFRSESEVGIYSAASNCAIYLFIFWGPLEASFTPVLAQLFYSGNMEKLKKLYKLVTFWTMALLFLPFIVMVIFNREILHLFGQDFIAGGTALIIISMALILDMIPGQIRQLLSMSEKQGIECMNSFATIIINLVLNFLLIPRFGMIGAAMATFISLLIVSTIRIVEIAKIFKFLPFTLRYVKLLIFEAIVFLISVPWFIKMGFILKIFSFLFIVICFVLLLYRLKRKEDLVIWIAIKRRVMNTKNLQTLTDNV